MASIADAILALLHQREEPATALTTDAARTVAPPPPVTPPVAPEAAPAMAPSEAPVAEAYKSPPDLVSMYERLMERSRNAAAMDRGMTLIAAGLAQDQNKEALIRMAGSAGGSAGAGGIGMDQLLQMQKYQDEQKATAARRAQLPALAKQYNLDDATVQYLDATGQLDETISKLADPTTEVVDTGKGKKLIDKRTGETIKELSPAPPRPTEYVEMGDKSKVLVYSDDKTDVTTGKPVTSIAAPAKPISVETLSDGTKQAVQDGKPFGAPWGPHEEKPVTIETLADGRKQAIQDGQPIFEPFGPAEEVSTDDIKELSKINEQERAAGLPETKLKDWILQRTRAGTESGNKDAGGIDYGDPLPGQAWKRDAAGKVVVDPDGAPVSVWIKNSKEYQEFQKNEAAAKTAADEAAKAATGSDRAAGIKNIKKSLVRQSIADAQKMITDNKDSTFGATGIGAYGIYSPFGGSEEGPKALAGKLQTIKANIGFDQLQEMRAESKTGSALGPVSDFENQLLQSVLGNLNQFGNDEVLAANLRKVDAAIGPAIDLIVDGVPDPTAPGGVRMATKDDIDAVLAAAEAAPVNTTPKDIGGGVTVRRTK